VGSVSISLDYVLTLLAALLIGTGFVLQQNAAQLEPESRFLSLSLITDLLRQRRWLTGLGCMVCGQILAAWSIGNLSLGFVEPLLTTNLVFALIVAVPIAKARIRFWEIFGALVLCLGVALLSAARSAKPIGLAFGSVTHWFVAAVIAGIAFAAVHYGRLHPGRVRAMFTGVGAGLIFGIQDALTRQTLEILSHHGISAMFTTWAPYALVGAGATGIWLMQSAFNSGPLPLSLPAISAGEPVVGILLGVLVFGDRIQITPGELALQAGGLVALVAGVIIVGRAPAMSQLRGRIPANLPHMPGGRPRRADVTRANGADRGHPNGADLRHPNGADLGHPNGTDLGHPNGTGAGHLNGADLAPRNGHAPDSLGCPGGVEPTGDQAGESAAQPPAPSPDRPAGLVSAPGQSWRAPSPQMAALNTVMPNSRNVTMCTPVQYSQMSRIW
jgi:drug/metabolite transporter (DMT)-like permease